MKYIIVPEFIHILLFYGGLVLALVSLIMGILGMVRKKGKRYFILWGILLVVSLAAVLLTISGTVVADTMLGG